MFEKAETENVLYCRSPVYTCIALNNVRMASRLSDASTVCPKKLYVSFCQHGLINTFCKRKPKRRIKPFASRFVKGFNHDLKG